MPEGYVEPAHQEGQTPREQGGILTGGWFEPWEHRHFSSRGTPLVHMFGMEPAYLERDAILDYHRTESTDETETEVELELEWAFTKRLGMVVEAPWARVEEAGESANTGVGDLAIAPRAVLVDTDMFLLSANLELSMPTGDEDRDLGAGETMLAPSFSLWADLGHWITFQAQAGTEHGIENGGRELFYGAGVSWSFLTRHAENSHSAHGSNLVQFPQGLMSCIAELNGRTVLDGDEDEEGVTTTELLLGASYALGGHWELRGGYEFPVGSPEGIDQGLVFGAIYHF